ncbi:TIGR03986 family type III CRISPR-associated RAMP protein [Paenibacillus sp. SYP-B4298]|uniref:TIGR03986 family type III CRISPR-associated RAMP protein n=1 Tax=Paenibacillus sp. SYP-B4298 TaxID=2996034 RepID=UPI0022DE31C7|nr:TIGR03986 family CRISPR-associated RAMP protein [Paenibacillus sp. SYP-B4298]
MSQNGNGKPERFVNPYNFVPLEGHCHKDAPAHANTGPLLTGYVECTLKTLTPLIIPNTSNAAALHQAEEKVEDGNSYDFFSYVNLASGGKGAANGKYERPVIPGSELRGVIRSVYEAAFNGCLSTVDLNRKLHRRTTQPKCPGLLRRNQDGGWEVEECERVMLNVKCEGEGRHGRFVSQDEYCRWREGELISVQKSRETFKTRKNFSTKFHVATDVAKGEKTDDGWVQGYLHKGEAFNSKHHESVFIPRGRTIPIADGELDRLKELLRQYADPKINRHKKDSKHSGYEQWAACLEIMEQPENKKVLELPVYYTNQRDKKIDVARYLTPAMISKEVFQTGVEELLTENGGYQPCDDRGRLCPACSLFGMTGDRSLASRVRFSDGEWLDNGSPNYSLMTLTLPELGEPKPGTVEFYTFPVTKQSSEGYGFPIWTYDYVTPGIQYLKKGQLKIRGRKFYWHHEPFGNPNGVSTNPYPADDQLSSMKQRVRAVDKGQAFTCRIYFDAVTAEELNRLRWALTFENADCAHKMGRGKPLGFGSVQVEMERIMVRQLDSSSGRRSVQELDQGILEGARLGETAGMKQLKKILNWSRKPSHVSYPLGDDNKDSGTSNSTASHQWFSANKSIKRGFFAKVLPTIDEELDKNSPHKWLNKLTKSGSNNKGQNKYSKNYGRDNRNSKTR